MIDSEVTRTSVGEFREDIYTGDNPYFIIEFEPAEGQDTIDWFWPQEEGASLDLSVTIQQNGILNIEVLRRVLLNIAEQL